MIRWWRRRAGGERLQAACFAPPEGATAELRIRLSDRALTLFRPRLGTAWLDTVEPAAGWPRDVTRQAAMAVALCQERRGSPTATGRRGTGPDTLVLNPAADDEFALLLALAPFSARVDVMSRYGQVVYASGPDRLVLRLFDDERAELTDALPDGAELQPVTKLDASLETDSRRIRLLPQAITVLLFGPAFVTGAAERLLRQPSMHDTLRQLVNPFFLWRAVVGIAAIVLGWQVIREAVSRAATWLRLARRRRALERQAPQVQPAQPIDG